MVALQYNILLQLEKITLKGDKLANTITYSSKLITFTITKVQLYLTIKSQNKQMMINNLMNIMTPVSE